MKVQVLRHDLIQRLIDKQMKAQQKYQNKYIYIYIYIYPEKREEIIDKLRLI